jgi:hypothetical protein
MLQARFTRQLTLDDDVAAVLERLRRVGTQA